MFVRNSEKYVRFTQFHTFYYYYFHPIPYNFTEYSRGLALRKLITPPDRNDKAKPSYGIFLFGTK